MKELSKGFAVVQHWGDRIWSLNSAKSEGFFIKTAEGPYLKSKNHVPELRARP